MVQIYWETPNDSASGKRQFIKQFCECVWLSNNPLVFSENSLDAPQPERPLHSDEWVCYHFFAGYEFSLNLYFRFASSQSEESVRGEQEKKSNFSQHTLRVWLNTQLLVGRMKQIKWRRQKRYKKWRSHCLGAGPSAIFPRAATHLHSQVHYTGYVQNGETLPGASVKASSNPFVSLLFLHLSICITLFSQNQVHEKNSCNSALCRSVTSKAGRSPKRARNKTHIFVIWNWASFQANSLNETWNDSRITRTRVLRCFEGLC